MKNASYVMGGGNLTFGKAGLAEGTNANTIKTTAAVDYTINGRFYTKAITDNIAMTACDTQAAGTTCLYLVSVNAAGTVTTTKGREVSTVDLANGATGLQWPSLPEDNAAIGAFKIVTDATNTFTSGTTDLSATGVTDTYYDLSSVPGDNI